MRFQKDEVVAEALERLWEETAGMVRGDLISWERIEEAMQLPRDHSKVKNLVGKLKRRFERQRGITLWAEPTVGYRLCTTQEQLIVCSEKRSRRAGRQIRMGVGHMTAINDKELTRHQKIIRTARVDSQKRALREVRAARKRDALILRPTNNGRFIPPPGKASDGVK